MPSFERPGRFIRRTWADLQLLKSQTRKFIRADGSFSYGGDGSTGATHGHSSDLDGGDPLTPQNLKFVAAVALTLASDAVTLTQSHHTIDTQAAAASDDLATVNGLVANQLYIIRPANDARTIVVKNGTGNIDCIGGLDITLDDVEDWCWLFSPDGVRAYAFADTQGAGGVHALATHSDDTGYTAALELALLSIDDAVFNLNLVSSNPRMTLNTNSYAEWNRAGFLLSLLDTAWGKIDLDVATPALNLFTQDTDANPVFLLDGSVGGFLAGAGGASAVDIGLRRAAAGFFNITAASGSNIRDLGARYVSLKSASGAITAMTNASAQLEMLATDRGFKPNAVTTTQRDAISSPADGLVVYNTDNDRLEAYDTAITAWAPVDARLTMIEIVLDGGGSALTTGAKLDLVIPFNCVPTAWDALPDQSGSIVVDVWKDTYANYPPTVADTITGSEGKPTISSATKAQDTAWAPGAWTRGNTLRFNVDSVTTIQRVTIAFWVRKT